MLAEIIPKIAGMNQRDWKYKHRCSNATYGEKCIRQQVYQSLDLPAKSLPGRSLLIMDDSSWHEELTADWIRKSTYKLHSQQMKVKVYMINGKWVEGSIDYIITDLNGEDYITEHKAINHFTFTKYEEAIELPYDYVSQVCHYIKGLKKDTGKLMRGLLLIKNKNTSRYIEYYIDYDEQEDIARCQLFTMDYEGNPEGVLVLVKEFFVEQVLTRAKKRFEEVDEYVRKKTLPKRQYTIDDWHCQYCRYAGLCWQDYEKEVDERKENIRIDDKKFIADSKVYLLNKAQLKELSKQAKELENEQDKIETEFKQKLSADKIKSALIGKALVVLESKTSSKLNKKAIPEQILLQATIKSPKESIKIENIELKKSKKGE